MYTQLFMFMVFDYVLFSLKVPKLKYRNVPDKWEHDMYDGVGRRSSAGGGVTRRSEGLSTGGSHLQISNLDFGVTESDIRVRRY